MTWVLRLILEGILGYLMQNVAIIIGMHAMAKHKLSLKPAALASALCAVFTIIVRNCGLFNFGVHTMLVLLAVNAACVFICKMKDVRGAILGSIVMILMILLGELINVGILSIFYPLEQINELMVDPVFKAAWAIPGNVVHLIASGVMYIMLMKKNKA